MNGQYVRGLFEVFFLVNMVKTFQKTQSTETKSILFQSKSYNGYMQTF